MPRVNVSISERDERREAVPGRALPRASSMAVVLFSLMVTVIGLGFVRPSSPTSAPLSTGDERSAHYHGHRGDGDRIRVPRKFEESTGESLPVRSTCREGSMLCADAVPDSAPAAEPRCALVETTSPPAAHRASALRARLRRACPDGAVIQGDSMARQLFLTVTRVLRGELPLTATSQATPPLRASAEHYFHADATLRSTWSSSNGSLSDVLHVAGDVVSHRGGDHDDTTWDFRFVWDESDAIGILPRANVGSRSGNRNPCSAVVLGYHFLYSRAGGRVSCDLYATPSSPSSAGEGKSSQMSPASVVVLPPASLARASHELSKLNALLRQRESCVKEAGVLGPETQLMRLLATDSSRCDGMHFSCQVGPKLPAQSSSPGTCAHRVKHAHDKDSCDCVDIANWRVAVELVRHFLKSDETAGDDAE